MSTRPDGFLSLFPSQPVLNGIQNTVSNFDICADFAFLIFSMKVSENKTAAQFKVPHRSMWNLEPPLPRSKMQIGSLICPPSQSSLFTISTNFFSFFLLQFISILTSFLKSHLNLSLIDISLSSWNALVVLFSNH